MLLTQNSLRLFDQLAHVHGLTKTCRPLVNAAALYATYCRRTKEQPSVNYHAEFFAKHLPGLSSEQVKLVEDAVSLARTDLDRDEFDARTTEGVGVPRITVINRMAAILRLADELASADDKAELCSFSEEGGAICLVLRMHQGSRRIRDKALGACDYWNWLLSKPVRDIEVIDFAEAETPLVYPSDPIATAGRKVVLRQMEQFKSRLYGLSEMQDIEYVHEMRVSTRRMRAALKLLKNAFSGEVADAKERLSIVASALGKVRDSDVFMEFLNDYAMSAPEQDEPWLSRLIRNEARKRAQRYRELIKVMKSPSVRQFQMEFHDQLLDENVQRNRLTNAKKKGLKPVALAAPRILDRGLAKVLKHKGPLEFREAGQLHKLRIACKRLRYAAEFVSEVYPDGLTQVVRRMTKMQDLLGDLHDSDVYMERIEQYMLRSAEKGNPAMIAAMDRLTERLKERREGCLNAACVKWDKYTSGKRLKQMKSAMASPYSPALPRIEHVEFGRIVVDGKSRTNDILVTAKGKVVPRDKSAARELYGSSHFVGPAELNVLCVGSPKLIYIGTGHGDSAGVTEDGRELLVRRGVGLKEMPTPALADVFNGDKRPKAALIQVAC